MQLRLDHGPVLTGLQPDTEPSSDDPDRGGSPARRCSPTIFLQLEGEVHKRFYTC